MPGAKKKKGPMAGKRVRGKAKNRDPNKPKRPRSAYNLYASDHYQRVRKEQQAIDPESKATAVISHIAVEWKALPAKAKKPYLQKAAEAKKLHDAAMAEYKEKEKTRKAEFAKTSKNDKTRPKRPMSAYLFFGKAKRAEVKAKLSASAPVTDVMKEIAQLWAALPEKGKAPYNKEASDARAVYTKLMAKWRADQKAVLHSSWKNKWKEARKAEVAEYHATMDKLTGAQLLALSGDDAKDIKRKTKPGKGKKKKSGGTRV